MRNEYKKLLSIALMVSIIFGSVPMNGLIQLDISGWLGKLTAGVSKCIDSFSTKASASEEFGTYGSNITWSFNSDSGTLEISGTGNMPNDSPPWSLYSSGINRVTINTGVASIGADAFDGCASLTSITIPVSVMSIGDGAFGDCTSDLMFYGTQTQWEQIEGSNSVNSSCFVHFLQEVISIVLANEPGELQYYVDDAVVKPGLEFDVYYDNGAVRRIHSGFACTPEILTQVGNQEIIVEYGDSSASFTVNVNEFTPEKVEIVSPPNKISYWLNDTLDTAGLVLNLTYNGGREMNITNGFTCDRTTLSEVGNQFVTVTYMGKTTSFHIYVNLAGAASQTLENSHRYVVYDCITSWSQAKDMCQKLGGHLVTITDSNEQAVVAALAESGTLDRYWIGATDEVSEGTWKWVTGESWSYTNWATGEPNNTDGVEDYLLLWTSRSSYASGLWNDDSSAKSFGFICEFESKYVPEKTIISNGHMYSLYFTPKTWENAKLACEVLTGHLVTITSADEQRIVEELLTYGVGQRYWIGATDKGHEGDWTWVTGEEFSYTNWASSQPDNANSTEHYAHTFSPYDSSSLTNKWNDAGGSCVYGFIYERELASAVPVKAVAWGCNYYEVYNNFMSWEEAEAFAESKGGHLMTITNEGENDIATYLANSGGHYAYQIGATDKKNEGVWEWVTGESFIYSPWLANQPDNQLIENYSSIYSFNNAQGREGKWNDFDTSFSHVGFIVEYDGVNVNYDLNYGGILPNLIVAPDVSDGWIEQSDGTLETSLDSVRVIYDPSDESFTFDSGEISTKKDGILFDYRLKRNITQGSYLTMFSEYDSGACIHTNACPVLELGTNRERYWMLPRCAIDLLFDEGSVNYRNGWLSNVDGGYSCGPFTPEQAELSKSVSLRIWNSGRIAFNNYKQRFVINLSDNPITEMHMSPVGKRIAYSQEFGDLTTPVREGYTFVGWYTKPVGGERITSESIMSQLDAQTIYAHWIVNPDRIEFDTNSLKTDYLIGDTFEPSDISASVIFCDGTSQPITEGLNVSAVDTSQAGTVTVAVEFMGLQNEYDINIYDVVSIELTEEPDRLNYSVGETLDTAGMIITATYSNGEQHQINSGHLCSPTLFTRAGKKLINVTFGSCSTRFAVNVSEDVLPCSLSLISPPAKTTYNVDEVFDPSGMALLLTYNNGTTREITEDFTTHYDFTTDGVKNVDLSYAENSTTVTASVAVTVLGTNNVISANSVTAMPGGTIGIPISISNNTGIMGFQIDIAYDSSAFVPVSVRAGNALTDSISGGQKGTIDNSISTSVPGSFCVVWTSVEDTTDNGVLFTVYFNVASAFTGLSSINLSYNQGNTFNEQWNDVVLNCCDIDVTFDSPDIAPYFSAQDVTTAAGSTFDVPIVVANNNSMTAFSLDLSYDHELLTPVSVVSGNAVSGSVTSNITSAPSGILNVCWSGQAMMSDGTVFIVRFLALEGTEGTSPFCMTCNVDGTSYSGVGTAYANSSSITVEAAHSAENTRVFVEPTTLYSGKTISVPVNISGNNGIMGFTVFVGYDSDVLTPISVARGEITASGNLDSNIDHADAGSLKVIWNSSENMFEDGAVFYLNFSVSGSPEQTSTSINLDYSQPDTYNESWQDVRLTCENASLNINKLTLIASDSTLIRTNTLQLTAVFDLDENTAGELLWSSSDNSVATVNGNGIVTGIAIGTVTITAQTSDNEVSASYTLTVLPKPFTLTWNIDGRQTVLQVAEGSVVAAPTVQDISGYTFIGWTPSVPEIMPSYDVTLTAVFQANLYTITFIADGRVVAVKEFALDNTNVEEPQVPPKAGYVGRWELYTYKAQDITVNAIYDLPVAIVTAQKTLYINESYRLLTSANFTVTSKKWRSSDTSVATVSSNGFVTGVSAGKCTITVEVYGTDSSGNSISARSSTTVFVKNVKEPEYTSFNEWFRAKFDEFFKVTLHDIVANLERIFLILYLLR